MKLWQKNYTLNKKIETFTVGDDPKLDLFLLPYDCKASLAHASMLKKIGILNQKEYTQIQKKLNEIITLHNQGKFKILQEDEDCHTAIENYLTKHLGDTGKKIHTARSRNDQIQTALRLYYKDQLTTIQTTTDAFIQALKTLIKNHGTTPIPGFTHMRKAMPSSIGLWAEAFIESMNDNKTLIQSIETLIDQSPLGTGAGYGIPLDIDRTLTQHQLEFKTIQHNPLYVQNSRGKFESTILHILSQIMLDLNKIASDLILFSMPEFGYIQLPDTFCTGSSIMPQKKNPDVLELIRAQYHTIISYEFQIKSTIANLISGYNRDLQLTKKPTLQGLQLTYQSLDIMTLLIKNLKINQEQCKNAMTKELFATQQVYNLVKQGKPFREAYQTIAKEYND